MKIFLCCVTIFLAVQNSHGAIPSDLKLCEYGDLTCIANQITKIANGNPHGRKDLNLPNLEPLHVQQLNIGEGGGSNFNIQLKDVDLYGLSSIKIDRAVGFGPNPNTSKFEIYAHIPEITLKGNYKASGRILVLPIQGDGPFEFKLDNVKVSIKIKPAIIRKNDKIYIRMEKLKLLLEPAKLSIKLENLFNGDRALGDNLNKFLNENWQDLWTDIAPSINNGMGEVIRVIISNVFTIGSYSDLFSSRN